MTIAEQTKRIHPLVAVAATTVTLFSLLGIAAITGILPTSRGEAPEPIASEAPRDLPVREQSAVQQGAAQQPVAQAKANANTAAKKGQTVAAQPAAEPVAAAQQPVAATQPPAVAHQKPVAQNSPVGIGVGAVIGGVIGNQMGSGDGKTLATIAGAIGGGYLGNEIAKNAKP